MYLKRGAELDSRKGLRGQRGRIVEKVGRWKSRKGLSGLRITGLESQIAPALLKKSNPHFLMTPSTF